MKTLKAIILNDFKGVKEARYDFGKNTTVSGRNGTGKTTIYDAHLWLWTDRDSTLRSNPNIRPDDGRECIPQVTEIWDVDGTELVISKAQKRTVSKPNAQGISKVSLTNSYEINSVPKAERDFKSDLTDKGFDFDNFLALSHLEVFVGKKIPEMRQVLFNMAHSMTDVEVAEATDGCEEVAELLKSYKMDEISAMNKASRKKAMEQQEAIPNQIIGLEKAKITINIPELEEQKKAIQAQINDLQALLEETDKQISVIDSLSSKMLYLRTCKAERERNASIELNGTKVAIEKALDDLKYEKAMAEKKLSRSESDLSDIQFEVRKYKSAVETSQKEYENLASQEYDSSKLDTLKAEKYDEHRSICPYCGQELPENMRNKNRMEWDSDHEKRIAQAEEDKKRWESNQNDMLKAVKDSGAFNNAKLAEAEKQIPVIEALIAKYKDQIADLEAQIAAKEVELKAVPDKPDLSGDKKYKKIIDEIAQSETDMKAMSSEENSRKDIESQIDYLKTQSAVIDNELAKAENNNRIDQQIFEMNKELRDYAQTQADAEKILYEISLISKHKNELLTDEINSHFNGVRFELFDYQKNGEIVDSCICYVWNGEEWHRLEDCCNTGLRTVGKIAIVDGLQKFYNDSLPVFIDCAEGLDSQSMNRIMKTYDLQFIALEVTDERQLTIEILED